MACLFTLVHTRFNIWRFLVTNSLPFLVWCLCINATSTLCDACIAFAQQTLLQLANFGVKFDLEACNVTIPTNMSVHTCFATWCMYENIH